MHDAADHLLERQRGARSRRPGRRCASGAALERGARPRPNHHGTPFIAGSTSVCAASSGAMRRRHLGQRLALDGDHHQVLRAELGALLRRACAGALRNAPPWRSRQPCVRSAASVAPRASALTSCAPVERQPRADEAADRAGADHTDLHALAHPRLNARPAIPDMVPWPVNHPAARRNARSS